MIKVGGQIGWICPICDKGISPFIETCPCRDKDVKPDFDTIIWYTCPLCDQSIKFGEYHLCPNVYYYDATNAQAS